MFLISGAMSIPRRWAVHLPEWHLQAQIASAFAVLIVLAAALFVLRYLTRIGRS
jgi:cytochrome c oxidase subunit 1